MREWEKDNTNRSDSESKQADICKASHKYWLLSQPLPLPHPTPTFEDISDTLLCIPKKLLSEPVHPRL